MTSTSKSQEIKYIYHLPIIPQIELCEMLNVDNTWEILLKHMKFDDSDMRILRKERNPTEKLLKMWGAYNHTVLELLVLFKQMKLYRAMLILKPYVPIKYHKHISNAEDGFTQKRKDGHEKETISKNPSLGTQAEFSSLLPKVPYAELENITENWSTNSVLGKGGFGTVHKAVWKNTMVAIKRIECKRCKQQNDIFRIQWEQLIREITILNSRIHENILLLYAYSIDGIMPCLIYQFMPNGSLEDNLLLRNTKVPLSWLQRHQIATGIACGLQYLHTIGEKPLIHADIKTANILLDKNMEPKIGDFGLAKEGIKENMMTVSKIQGTRPYLPEEFIYGAQFSTKVDIFSYGIVLYEMATGLRPYDPNRVQHKILKDFVQSIVPSELSILMDQKPNPEYEVVFYNFIALGKICCKKNPYERPEMDVVFQNLNSIVVLES